MDYRRIFTVVALAACAGAFPLQANSVGLGIEVTPAKLDAELSPGALVNVPLTVHNGGVDSAHVQATMVDFTVNPGGDYQFVQVGTRANSLLKYAAIRPREFDIAQQTSQQVQLTISLPQNGHLSGEYAGIVFFQTRPDRHAGQNVALSVRVASKVYIAIPNTVKLDGAIEKMSAAQSAHGETYRVLFRNTGNAHVYLRGALELQKNGQTVAQISMPTNMLVERGGSRLVQLSGTQLPAGDYQAVATIDYGGKTETGGAINFNVK